VSARQRQGALGDGARLADTHDPHRTGADRSIDNGVAILGERRIG
jgi:hypothetical protein